MNLLVTGGAGFIGSNLIRQLLTRSATEVTRLVNLDCLTYAGHLENLRGVEQDSRYVFERRDLRNKAAVLRVVRDYGVTHVMHLAAESHVDRSIDGPGDFIQTNIVGTFNLLETCRACWLSPSGPPSAVPRPESPNELGSPHGQEKMASALERDRHLACPSQAGSLTYHALGRGGESEVSNPPSAIRNPHSGFRFLHVSTDEVYGSLGATGYFTETTPYAPNSPYSASKASSDMLVRAYHHTYGLPAIITNCSNNYGPYQFPEKLIPVVIQSLLARKPVPVYGDGMNVRDWLYVADHAEALWLALTRGRPGETYNVGGSNEWPNIRIVEVICDLVDEFAPGLGGHSRRLISFVKDRPGHDRRYAIDSTRIQKELGWKPGHDFQSGIRETVKWYLDNQDWVRAVTG